MSGRRSTFSLTGLSSARAKPTSFLWMKVFWERVLPVHQMCTVSPLLKKVREFMGTFTKAQYCYHGLVYNQVGRLPGQLLLCGGADSLFVN